jgi:hypothetical protein
VIRYRDGSVIDTVRQVKENIYDITTPVRAGVSLEALLAAKERRAARQADWLSTINNRLSP